MLYAAVCEVCAEAELDICPCCRSTREDRERSEFRTEKATPASSNARRLNDNPKFAKSCPVRLCVCSRISSCSCRQVAPQLNIFASRDSPRPNVRKKKLLWATPPTQKTSSVSVTVCLAFPVRVLNPVNGLTLTVWVPVRVHFVVPCVFISGTSPEVSQGGEAGDQQPAQRATASSVTVESQRLAIDLDRICRGMAPPEEVIAAGSAQGYFDQGAVSADHQPCADIGCEILKQGGSAVDAAIATLLGVGVSFPHSMGLGGGCLMTIYKRDTRTAVVIDAREVAPLAATEDMFHGDRTLTFIGGLTMGVPGELKGYWEAHQRYGKLKWYDLFQPAISLCRQGIEVGFHMANALRITREFVLREPTLREVYVNPETGDVYKEGEFVCRPDLADTLELIAQKGADVLYNGELGQKLVNDIQKQGSIITMEDLRAYRVRIKDPITVRFPPRMHANASTTSLPGMVPNMSATTLATSDYGSMVDGMSSVSGDSEYDLCSERCSFSQGEIESDRESISSEGFNENLLNQLNSLSEFVPSGTLTMYNVPPPGSGALMAMIMNVLNGYSFGPQTFHNNESRLLFYHRFIEACKFAYARRTELGDDAFIDVHQLTSSVMSTDYAESIRARITDNMTFSASHYGARLYQPDDYGTAHVSVIAPNGDAISITSSINQYFGAKVRSSSTGIIMNNVMGDFSSPNITNYFGLPPSKANFIRPGKRPLSSMCPGIFVDDLGDVKLVIGSAGGTRITSGTALIAMRALWLKEELKSAIDTPRIHHQLFPENLLFEKGFDDDTIEALQKLGHEPKMYEGGGPVVVAIQRLDDGRLHAVADYRKGGGTAGF